MPERRRRRSGGKHFLFRETDVYFYWQLTRNTLFFWGGGINLFYLEAIEGDKQPQDVVGALEDSEYSQISHHSLHSGILQGNDRGSSPGGEIPTGGKAAEQVKQKNGQVLLKLQRDISILVNCEMMQLLHFPSFLPFRRSIPNNNISSQLVETKGSEESCRDTCQSAWCCVCWSGVVVQPPSAWLSADCTVFWPNCI